MIKNKYLLFLFFFIVIIFPFLIRYFLISKKISLLNRIYFNFPASFINKKKCPSIDNLLKNLDSTFSVSIVENGSLISSYNSEKLILPASNQKLFSSAYVLNKYKLKDKLKTSLLKTNNSNYYLVGQGDPDLSYEDIIKLISSIKANKYINVNLIEINSKLHWPNGWTNLDKLYEYGAPITTLAIESNNNKYENYNYLNTVIEEYLKNKFPKSKIKIKYMDSNEIFYLKNAREIKKVFSNPFISLLTLSNSESHNFTAESLFKNASKTWNNNKYYKLKNWLRNKGLPVENTYFADASGLSRNNKITTNLMVYFLDKMQYSKNFKTYQSTLSVMGVRGTLANSNKKSGLSGKFFGKTGTLSNVFALSGYLYKDKEPIIISIIQNSNNIDKNKSFKLLNDIYYLKSCKYD